MSTKKINHPSSLYIHIPFCNFICDYCDFTKLQYFRIFAEKYLISLKSELDSYDIGKLKTIYIGGGTPTSLEDDLFEELLKMVFPYTDGVEEFTIEANPESLSKEKLQLMKKYGVNRISIGVESTNDKILSSINRKHTFEDVKNSINLAKLLGFDNISVDLILGLPNITKDLLIKDLDNVLSLPINHISCYSLTVHPNTEFFNKGIKPLPSDIEREYYDIVNEKLTKEGYEHYEISSWSKNKESKHNLVYWNNEQYYGIGLGASGYINNIRYTNTNNLTKYINNIYIKEKEEVSLKDEFEYQIMLNLRTKYGLNLAYLNKRFNVDLLKTYKQKINQFINSGLLLLKDNHLIATYEGMMILDQIISKLI